MYKLNLYLRIAISGCNSMSTVLRRQGWWLSLTCGRRCREAPTDILWSQINPLSAPQRLSAGFEGTYHPEVLVNTAKRYAIVRANRIMVDSRDWLICYVRHGASNSRKLLEYAQRRAARGLIQIENIGENESGK